MTNIIRNVVLFFLVLLPSAWAESRPNVVLFIADDMSQDAGCYGNQEIHTPSIDALAAESTRFTHAFCTTASCSPSRAVIMTGMHSHRNGQYGLAHGEHNFYSREGLRTLPVLMREAGYRTARIGRSVHIRPRKAYEFELTLPAPNEPLTMEKRLYGRNIVQCAQDAKRFVLAESDKPFFLMFCANDAHRFGTKFDNKPGRPNTFANDHAYTGVKEVIYDPKRLTVPSFLSDTEGTRAELAEYYRSVSRVDQGVGALVEILKQADEWNNTLFIFIADHGMAFPGAKTTVYEPGLRCPCIIRCPDKADTGATSDAMVSWVDIAPTILDFANALPDKYRFDGRSLKKVLYGGTTNGWDEVFASHTFHEVTMYYPMRVVRTRRFKLILNVAFGLEFPSAEDLWSSATWQSILTEGTAAKLGGRTVEAYLHRPKFELYDLKNDPDELHNLARDEEHQETLKRLVVKLQNFQNRTRDPWRKKWKHE